MILKRNEMVLKNKTERLFIFEKKVKIIKIMVVTEKGMEGKNGLISSGV